MKTQGAAGSRQSRPRNLPARVLAEGTTGELPMGLRSRRPPARRTPAGPLPWRATSSRQAAALESVAVLSDGATQPLVADGLEPIEARLLRAIGAHRRVMVVAHGLDRMAPALLANGCQVVRAELATEPSRSATGASSRVAIVGSRTPGAPARPAAGRFDVVALRHTLECAGDPVGLLTGLKKQLTSDGYIVAAIPNVTHGSLRLRLLAGQSPFAWLSPTAGTPTAFYDESSIRRMFERAGLVVTRLERNIEPFDATAPTFNGASLPAELITQLTGDVDALTSAFVVVAHRFPLSNRTLREVRVNELMETMEDRSRAQVERIDAVDRRVDLLSNQLAELRQTVESRHDPAPAAPEQNFQAARDALGAHCATAAAFVKDLHRLQYDQLTARVLSTVEAAVPRGAIVLVVSKGDERLLALPDRTGWHFLQNAKGVYAGHHPADSRVAIEEIERLRSKGARYLVFPHTSLWWLDHYVELRTLLDTQFSRIVQDPRTCVIYSLSRTASRP